MIGNLHNLDTWRSIFIVFTALGQTLFVLFYMTLPWWRTFLGRALFVKATTFGLLVDTAVAGIVLDWRYEDACIVFLYGLVGVGVWGQLIAFVRQAIQSSPPSDHQNSYDNEEPHHDHQTT
jgi:hypothetical protein